MSDKAKRVGPVRPDEVADLQKSTFPAEVFEAFNELIAEGYSDRQATVRQDDAVKRILQKTTASGLNIDKGAIFRNGWLNVGDAYRSEGWEVTFDKPGFNESYPATFTFRAKNKGGPR